MLQSIRNFITHPLFMTAGLIVTLFEIYDRVYPLFFTCPSPELAWTDSFLALKEGIKGEEDKNPRPIPASGGYVLSKTIIEKLCKPKHVHYKFKSAYYAQAEGETSVKIYFFNKNNAVKNHPIPIYNQISTYKETLEHKNYQIHEGCIALDRETIDEVKIWADPGTYGIFIREMSLKFEM